MKPVTHLHFHSEYSLQDSTIKIDQLSDLVRKKEVKALALTDHGNVDGAVKFYKKLEDTDCIPLLGCEFYVVDDLKNKTDRFRYHLTAIAKNRKGFNSIMKALTVANLEGFYYRPRLDWDYILKNLDDVVVMTACMDGMLRHPNWYDMMVKFKEKYEDDFYLEAMLLTDFKPYEERNELIEYLSEREHIKIAFTNDVHYPKSEDWTAREICFAVRYNLDINPKTYEENTENKTSDIYLKNYDEMVESLNCEKFSFKGYENRMVEVWDEIVEKCTFKLEQDPPTVPVAYEEAKKSPENYLKELCRKKFEKKRQEEAFIDEEEALQRMEHELKEICELGFSEYFLLVRDMVLEAKERKVMVGVGRGSVGGSLVAWLLDITGVNPLDYDLVFERFISPGRHDLPDIDLDFEDTKRDKVIDYLRQKYGERKVALVSTYAAMKGRGALRDVSRVFNVPLADVNEASKQILVRSGGDARASFSIEDTMSLFETAKRFKRDYPKVVREAGKLEGLLKNRAVHAAGVVVDTTDLYSGEKCVLLKDKRGEVVVNWDKKDLEYMGLMKIDVLGLKTLNILHKIRELVKDRRGDEIVWENIVPLDDKAPEGEEETHKEIIKRCQEGETVGVFQFGSTGMIQYLRDFMPENFKEMYQVSALYRPGTLRSGMANKFIRYKKKDTGEKPDYINDELKEILGETFGIVLFQEQIMYILNRLGNIPWRTADIIRKVVSKSEGQEKFETFRKQFLDGVRELKSMNDTDANKIFGLMKFFGSYGFNKSHSVEYTILSYWTMWAKVKYPLEFYCANLMREDDKDNISLLLGEADKRGIKMKLPHINKSQVTWMIEDENTLRAGFDIIKGISSRLSGEMIKAREDIGGEFKSFKEFYDNVPKRLVNIARVKMLLLADVFGDLLTDEERKKMILYIEQKKKVPVDLEKLEEIDEGDFEESEASKQEVYNYELAEAFYTQNEVFLKEIIGRAKSKDKKTIEVEKLEEMKKIKEGELMKEKWFVGKFDEIKYGYRTAIDKKKETVDTRGHADDLGGVYGIFRDDTYLYYATFGSKLYKSDLKAKIEDAAGKYMLIRADKPLKSTNLFVQELYFIDDIKEGMLTGDLLGGLLSEQEAEHKELREEISDCSECKARESCKKPISFSCGSFDATIIGEAPGREEEREGEGFVGQAGRLLWENLGLDREYFHITNVQKCKPAGEYNAATGRACAKRWLVKELEAVKPKLILSFGTAAYQWLSGDRKGGVYKKLGMIDESSLVRRCVEWNKALRAWVVYTVHPAWILRNRNKTDEWRENSLGAFIELFGKLI